MSPSNKVTGDTTAANSPPNKGTMKQRRKTRKIEFISNKTTNFTVMVQIRNFGGFFPFILWFI